MTAAARSDAPVELFYSYSHRDERLRDRVDTHLAVLKREGLISSWHDRKIGAGVEWKDQIDAHLDRARVILLLVSPDFLASDYCYDREMKRALERHEAGLARVIPVILRPPIGIARRSASFRHCPPMGSRSRPGGTATKRSETLPKVSARRSTSCLDHQERNHALPSRPRGARRSVPSNGRPSTKCSSSAGMRPTASGLASKAGRKPSKGRLRPPSEAGNGPGGTRGGTRAASYRGTG